MIQKILNFFTKWDKDKVLHFALSLIISMVAALIAKLFVSDWETIVFSAWFSGFIAGIGKELYDEYKYKGADVKDWAADLVGTTVGTILVTLFVI